MEIKRPWREVLLSLLRDRRGWFNLLLLFVTLEIAVFSVEQAHWITPQPAMTLVLFLSITTTWLMVTQRLHGLIILTLELALGVLLTYWQISRLQAYPETVYFAVFITTLIWLMGYISTWFFLRKGNAWVAVVLGTLVILVNLSNLPFKYYFYFGFYFVVAVFLLVQTRLVRRRNAPSRSTRYTRRGFVYFTVILLCLVIVAVSVSWVMPDLRFPQLQTWLTTGILWKHNLEKSRFNIFASVPSKQSMNTAGMILDLPFEASWHEGEQVDFVVDSTSPSYWRVRSYDTYTGKGWENTPTSDTILESNKPWQGTAPPPESATLTYTVTPNIKADIMLTSGSFVSSNKPVILEVSGGEVVGAISSYVINAGEHYTITTSVSQATPEELDHSSNDYPETILKTYLQLPQDFPQRISQLSANLTRDADTAFQKILAINTYLAKIPYQTNINLPPPGVDGVSYFLFTQKSGFCVHFASAMAVMLRSVGVPARLAVGYLPGEPGSKNGEYILRDKMYHAWTQVYFPDYGWVDIEATPNNSPGAAAAASADQPLVSNSAIAGLPQWDIWAQQAALYGFFGEPAARAGNSTLSAAPPRSPAGPWRFADELGKTILITGIVAFFLVLLAIPLLIFRSLFYRRIWRVNRESLAPAIYDKLCQLGSLIDLGPRAQQTPLEYAAILAAEFPGDAAAVREITLAYQQIRYGHQEESGHVDLFDEARLLKARRIIYESIIKRMGWMDRIFGGRL
jgi:transglutaminase-like putative cysteine protease